MALKKRKALHIAISILCLLMVLYFFSGPILTCIGKFLVVNEKPTPSDAVVVLNTGVEYYPRLIEAARLYRLGLVKKVVINGNRKTNALRELEKKGLKHCCPWYEERVRILELFEVPRKDVIVISAEDVYDTISESKTVGMELIKSGASRIIIVTSKSHTRRARHIWRSNWEDRLIISVIAASTDPYDTFSWWKEGRQVKWVLSEYGAWLYLFLKAAK